MSNNLKTTNKILKQLIKNPVIYFIFLAILGCSIFVIEFFSIFNFNLNTPIERWVATATYFSNVFSPILLFVSILLLYRTWKDSKEALEVQKLELIETRIVLKEQSDTQSYSVFKETLFQVIDQIKKLNDKKCKLKQDERKWSIFTDDNFNFRSIKESDMPFETFLQAYFFEMRSKPLENDELSLSFKSLIFDDTHIYIEKIKTIALLLNNIENNRYKPILEIAIFNRLTIFTWLFFIEIVYHLYIYSNDVEKPTSELVFMEVAGLTCRQLKDVYWIDALSDEVLLELKARKLL
ncbi:hypothetical protein [Pseudoalteromonas sp. TB51]|uniref:hypothetical protein n=1 Tax=Pseudoalteromonas sp. TB51 TaxID=1055803 RepID=UPI000FE149C2|nr:hypothetical protein [Pseudoalteromonas sp. TB51]